MAKGKRARGRRRTGWGLRIAGFLLLIGLVGLGYGWWAGQNWRPDETLWSDQGALVGASDGTVDFGTIKGLGAKFAYVEASIGSEYQDDRFPRNFAAARKAGLQVGAMHLFDPCLTADGQSANFVTMVPRDAELLPPAIALGKLADDCPTRVSDAAVQSELMTLVNQIEAHSGKPAILAPSKAFEERYRVARRIDRNLWLTQNWREPDYAGRPWLLWTANENFRTEAADTPLRWIVVQP